MASRYTYDDFQRALTGSGLGGQFSQSDLKLAQQNPDAGMSILKYKKDYASATTDEARALANLGAETVRSSWGGYTGGDTGGSFHLDPISPNDFSFAPAPTYSSPWTGEVQDLYNQQKNRGDYSFSGTKPTYNNRYDPTIQDLLDQIVNREAFSYDASTDPLYSQYRKQYTREGQRATADALGSAAAASGGIPSSYAATAAGQAGDYYASRMTDKIPELYQLAYNQYMNDHSMKLSDLSAVQGAEQNDYMKYLNDLSQYNTDRSFDYGVWSDAQQRAADDLQTAIGLEQLDYQKYRDQLSQYNTDRDFNYSQLLDEIGQQTQLRGEALNKAQLAAGYGDYSFLNGMGINTDKDPAEWERQYNLAVLAAQYGDYSGLRALGVNPDASGLYQFNLAASGGPRTSGGSGGSRSSGKSSGNSGGQDYEGLYWAALHSEHPQQFIANNYKKYGFSSSSGLYDGETGYLDWVETATPGSARDPEAIQRSQAVQAQTVNRSGDSWIHVPGYGRITWQELEEMVDRGEVLERYNAQTGKWSYTVNKGYKK